MPLDNRQQKWLPLGLNPSQDIATGSSCPGTPFPELSKVYAAEHQFGYLQQPFQSLLSTLNGRSNCDAAPPERTLKSSQKRFLVLDQSGNQTRLLQCGFFPSSVAAASDPRKILNFLNLEKGLSRDQAVPEKTFLHEDNGNREEESEMHEDTEEINALLYSDDDEEDNDDCESDDEVMSTGHSPFPVEQQQQACNNKTEEEEVDETTERCVDDDDDGPRLKRQKVLLDHYSYTDLSPSSSFVVCTTNLKGLSSDEKLAESNISSSNQEMVSGLSDEESRKDTALRILESVVPGAKGKEALLLLDEAIDYLKLLKRNLNSPKGLN
ncbi:hypothetical protein N665_0025s0179 [Sinapis alba]|nr:hypothetical protein N665_0025s0179 [Sinapis alba]